MAACALVLGAFIAWPWYAAMEQASPGYLRYFILERHLGGVAGEAQRHAGRPFWYYVPVLVGGAWPWLFPALRRPARTADLAERLVWSWLVADVVLLSAAGSKLATYLLPAFPAVALLAARRIMEAGGGAAVAPAWLVLTTALLPLGGVVYFAAATAAMPQDGGGLLTALAPPGARRLAPGLAGRPRLDSFDAAARGDRDGARRRGPGRASARGRSAHRAPAR